MDASLGAFEKAKRDGMYVERFPKPESKMMLVETSPLFYSYPPRSLERLNNDLQLIIMRECDVVAKITSTDEIS